jgi:hypothetical protein
MNPITEYYVNQLQSEYEQDLENYESRYKFIWGIISSDCLSHKAADLHSVNDIDIIYDKEDKKYQLSIETIYDFTDKVNCSKRYIKQLFDKLTEWMVEQGYDTEYKPNLWEVFTDFLGKNYGFNSIEELYGNFRFLVEKFCED